MPSLRHGKQAAQEQQENADAANRESSSVQAKRERDAAKPLEQSIKEHAGLSSDLVDIQKFVKLFDEDSKKLFEQMKAGLGQPKDTFQAAGPEGASQTQRDELRHTQQELLQKEQNVARDQRLDLSAKAVEEAVKSVGFAAQSLATRHEMELKATIAQHDSDLAKAAQADHSSGKFTTEEMAERQRERETRIANDVEIIVRNQADVVNHVAELLPVMTLAESFIEDLKKGLVEDVTFPDRLAQFNEKAERALAVAVLWNGRLADIECVKKTWERACVDLENTAKGFAKARERFWGILNNSVAADADAAKSRRLLDHAGAEWQKEGTKAPLMAGESSRMEEMRKATENNEQMRKRYEQLLATTRITIDHVADKSTEANRALTLAASNLRFMSNSDNSARGNRYGVSEQPKVNLGKSNDELEEARERTDKARGRSAVKANDRMEDISFGLIQHQIAEHQARAAVNRADEMRKANEIFEKKERELVDFKLPRLENEDEDARRARQEKVREALSQFHDAARDQLKELHASDKQLEAQLGVELQKTLQRIPPAQSSTHARLEVEKSFEARLEQLKIEVQALHNRLNDERNVASAQLLADIRSATTRAEQEERIQRAFEQQKTRAEMLEKRLQERERAHFSQE